MLSSEIIFARRVNEIALCTAPTSSTNVSISFEKNVFAKVFLEWDISNQNYLFGSGQKGSKCNAASRDKKHIKVLSEKAYFIMAGGTAVGILWHANLIVPF